MKSVNLKITSCPECPHYDSERDYTSDSFDFCIKWICNLEKRDVRRYVDWHDSKKFIPDWCPLAKKNEKIG